MCFRLPCSLARGSQFTVDFGFCHRQLVRVPVPPDSPDLRSVLFLSTLIFSSSTPSQAVQLFAISLTDQSFPFASKASSPLHQSQWPPPVFSPLAWPPPWPRSLALPCVSTLPTLPSVPSLVRELPHLELIVAQPVDLKRHRPRAIEGPIGLSIDTIELANPVVVVA